MKKLTLIVAMLAMVAASAVPALAQLAEDPAPAPPPAPAEGRCPEMPDVPCRVDSESGLYHILYNVSCAVFYDPSTSCHVDENGLIDLPDGTKAPYTVAVDYLAGPDGLYEYGDGEFVLVEAYPPAPPVTAEYIPPEICAVYRADGHCDTFRTSGY